VIFLKADSRDRKPLKKDGLAHVRRLNSALNVLIELLPDQKVWETIHRILTLP